MLPELSNAERVARNRKAQSTLLHCMVFVNVMVAESYYSLRMVLGEVHTVPKLSLFQHFGAVLRCECLGLLYERGLLAFG